MRRFSWTMALLSSLALAPVPALADDVMSFRMENGSIVATGAFALDTADSFRAFLAANGHAEGAWNTALFINSPGGNLVAALDMGRTIRERGISVVAVDLCASACTYMLMGGVNRVVTKDTRYAVHQFANGEALLNPEQPFYSAKDMEVFQALLADLHDYALTMGIDTQVVAIASRTPPDKVTVLTRAELLSYNVDNVPTANPEGQPREDVSIPGVIGDSNVATILPPLPVQPIKFNGLAATVAEAMARRIVMAETLDGPGMEASLANTYAINVNFNGQARSADDIMAEKRRMVADWGVRRRAIEDGSLEVHCSMNSIFCNVSGVYVYELGVSEDGFISKNRWRFSYEIILPLDMPRVTAETLALAQ
ncbi:MAG: ATP-dependent Clp protease proteolytic subunit [Proteobacteria bacterium]|nr:ATP-dependent Clp protease proteolytic subunit [Pseudomonadota bacterium]